jgi:hypothetical protein
VWSDAILAELHRARPGARFAELADTFGEIGYRKDGRAVAVATTPDYPWPRPPRAAALSLKLANYAFLSGTGATVSPT